MLKWFIKKQLAKFERSFGYDTSYVRDLLDTDTAAFFAFARIQKMGEYQKDIPKDVYYASRLIGSLAEDCGPCTQLGVTMGLRAGATPRVLALTLAGNDAALPDDVRLGVQFARATLAHSPDADDLREQIVARWGKRAVFSIALSLAAARVYPTVKYALGYGKTCQRVVVDGETVAVARSAA
jgi:hypothetical protein